MASVVFQVLAAASPLRAEGTLLEEVRAAFCQLPVTARVLMECHRAVAVAVPDPERADRLAPAAAARTPKA